LLDAPQDIPFLSGLIQREIIYRIPRAPEGARLRAIAALGDQSHRTAKAITWVEANYAKPLRVEELAKIAGMGVSRLHHHFRALAAMSPLQHQKQIRLQAARERMLVGGLDAAGAAFEVGYESAHPIQSRMQSHVRPTIHARHSHPPRAQRAAVGVAQYSASRDLVEFRFTARYVRHRRCVCLAPKKWSIIAAKATLRVQTPVGHSAIVLRFGATDRQQAAGASSRLS
jgi:AraC-like DNA-binding protein